MLYRLPPDAVEANLRKLLEREMGFKPSPFPPRWVSVETEEGVMRAITFCIDRNSPRYITGLSEEQKKALRDYVTAGGTLFVEAIGGKEEFAGSAADALKGVFPESKLKNVPPDYMLYTGSFTAHTAHIPEVEYRRYWVLSHGALTAPRIQYMNVNKRAAVFFSSEDLTSGLLGTNAWAIGGYSPESAVSLGRNLVLYAWRNFPKK